MFYRRWYEYIRMHTAVSAIVTLKNIVTLPVSKIMPRDHLKVKIFTIVYMSVCTVIRNMQHFLNSLEMDFSLSNEYGNIIIRTIAHSNEKNRLNIIFMMTYVVPCTMAF